MSNHSFFKYNKVIKSSNPDVIKGGRRIESDQEMENYLLFLDSLLKLSTTKEKSLKSKITF